MIAVDTSVWIDWLNDRSTAETLALRSFIAADEGVVLTDVVLAEVLQGARSEVLADRIDEILSPHDILRLEGLADFRFAAALYRTCRRAGVTIRRTTDCLIAAVCIRERVPLLHSDADFDRLAALTDLQVALPAGG